MQRSTKPGQVRVSVSDAQAAATTAATAARVVPTSESFYRALIEQTSDMVSVLDANGVILYASPAHATILGYEPEDLLGRNAFDFVPADDLPALRARFAVACTRLGQTASQPFHFRHADGSWRTLEAVGTNLLGDASVAGIVVNTRDVTERVRVDDAVAAQRRALGDQLAELDLLYRKSPVGLALIDRELRYVRINDRLAEINGTPPEQHVGRTPHEILGELGAALEPICRQVLEAGEPIAVEVHGATPAMPGVDKDWLLHLHRLDDADGRALGVSAVVEEISELKDAERTLQQAHAELETRVRERTAELVSVNQALRAEIAERERAEESLRRSEERYRDLVENINEVIFTVDANGRFTYISPAIERLSGGRSPGDMIGHSFLEFLHPDDAQPLMESFQRLLAGQPEPSEYRAFANDGTVLWLRSQSQTIVENGAVVGVRGVLTDVTARRLAEMEVRQRREELAHVQRLTTAGQMTAEIAHQINQPLAAIVNFAAGLAARLRDGRVEPDAMREVADRIADEAQRAGEVIRRLRAFLRKGESVPRECDLNQVVTRVCGLLEEDFRRAGVDLRLRLDAGLPMLRLDPILIEQVMLNLLRNALDAVADRTGPRCVEIATGVVAQGVRVAVRDTGVGLTPGSEASIFEAFFTTKPDGLGLGLSVSRTIIEASGGELSAERHADGGTIVSFVLPLAPGPVAGPWDDPAARRLSPPAKTRYQTRQ